jgi:hypothetical protein
LPGSEAAAAALDAFGVTIAEAIAGGVFERARALTGEAIRRAVGNMLTPIPGQDE